MIWYYVKRCDKTSLTQSCSNFQSCSGTKGCFAARSGYGFLLSLGDGVCSNMPSPSLAMRTALWCSQTCLGSVLARPHEVHHMIRTSWITHSHVRVGTFCLHNFNGKSHDQEYTFKQLNGQRTGMHAPKYSYYFWNVMDKNNTGLFVKKSEALYTKI